MLLKSQKSKQRIVGERKQFINFFEKWRILGFLAAYLSRGLFLQILYNSQIFVLINEIIKCFSNVVAGFSRSRRLLLEGIFYRRTNSAFSIRYIGEKISRLNLRHGTCEVLIGQYG